MFCKVNFKHFSAIALFVFSCPLLQAEIFYGPTDLADKTFNELTVNGPADLKRVKTQFLTVHGPLTFEDVEVTIKAVIKGSGKGEKGKFNALSLNGFFEGSDIKIGQLKAFGAIVLKDFTVHGTVNVHGPLKAEKGAFQDVIAGSKNGGESVEFTDVIAKNVVINEGDKEEVLLLNGNTTISGNVIFKSGRGRIETKGENNVIKGKVEGAVEAVKN